MLRIRRLPQDRRSWWPRGRVQHWSPPSQAVGPASSRVCSSSSWPGLSLHRSARALECQRQSAAGGQRAMPSIGRHPGHPEMLGHLPVDGPPPRTTRPPLAVPAPAERAPRWSVHQSRATECPRHSADRVGCQQGPQRPPLTIFSPPPVETWQPRGLSPNALR